MRIKISKVAKDLNVGVNTAVEFLRKHNVEIEDNGPNTRIDQSAVDLLTKEFSNDREVKSLSDGIGARKQERKERNNKNDRPKTEEISRVPTGGPKIVGKIDLDAPHRQATAESKMQTAVQAAPPKKEVKVEASKPEAPKPEPAKQPIFRDPGC